MNLEFINYNYNYVVAGRGADANIWACLVNYKSSFKTFVNIVRSCKQNVFNNVASNLS